jgi:hypothetical protein
MEEGEESAIIAQFKKHIAGLLPDFKRRLLDGLTCSKHSRKGRMTEITLILPPPFTEIRWKEAPGMPIRDVAKIQAGSKLFKKVQTQARDVRCLSVRMKHRNVDLEFDDKESRDYFKQGLELLINHCSEEASFNEHGVLMRASAFGGFEAPDIKLMTAHEFYD